MWYWPTAARERHPGKTTATSPLPLLSCPWCEDLEERSHAGACYQECKLIIAEVPLSPDAPHIDDATVSRTDRDLEAAVSAPGSVDEVTSTAVHAAYVTEATIAQQAFAL